MKLVRRLHGFSGIHRAFRGHHHRQHAPGCPCCLRKLPLVSSPGSLHRLAGGQASVGRVVARRAAAGSAGNEQPGDYAFEMAASSIRFGRGVTRELGWDCATLLTASSVPAEANGRVALFADPFLAADMASPGNPVSAAVSALETAGVPFDLFAEIAVEPTKRSFERAIQWARSTKPSVYVAVGGGSTMDTCKVAALYQVHPEAPFVEFVNAPLGRGTPVDRTLPPVLCVPTTAGTGSETTGVAVFDWTDEQTGVSSKTGIASPRMRPLLGVVDPAHTDRLPAAVATAAAFDVLAHALESLTATPFWRRTPRPEHPRERPAYQGSNPIADHWSLAALRLLADHLVPAVKQVDAEESRSQLMLAATMAGVGFGSAGVHLCHGLSYPVSSLVKQRALYRAPGYPGQGGGLLPHGLSVILHAPAVFEWTAHADPQRHLLAAQALGVPGIEQLAATGSDEQLAVQVGQRLADHIRCLMRTLDVPEGLAAVGVTENDLEQLVQGTLPQHRVTKLSPRPVDSDSLYHLFKGSM